MKLNKIALMLSLTSLVCGPVLAQDVNQGDNAENQESEKVERIRVTGSSIKRTAIEGDLPLTVFTRADIDAQGITSAEQLMQQLNIAGNGADNLASNNGIVSAEQRGNNGVSGANLRGQGADATLVLLNGRRVATHGLKGRAVDLNSIPFAALERVEVLRDGASAVYGTDAIGGVINFITKRDYQGADVSAFVDVTEAGGGNIYRTSALFGAGDLLQDGYNVFATVSYKKNTVLRGIDRDFANTFQPERGLSPDTRGTPFATVFNRGSSQPNLIGTGLTDPAGGGTMSAINILNLPGAAGCETGGDMMGPYGYRLWGVAGSKYACAWDYPQAQSILQPQESVDFVSRATFAVADNHEVFVELVGSRVDVAKSFEAYQVSPGSTFGPSSWYPSTGASYDLVYDALAGFFDPAQLNYGQPIAYRWRCIPCGNREIETTTDSYRLQFGAEGMVGTWDYAVGFGYSENESESLLGGGYYFTSDFVAALGGGNLNPFLLPGQSQTTAAMQDLAAASARGVKLYGGVSSTTQIDAVISGDVDSMELGGGLVQVAIGADLRREEFEFNGDERAEMRSIFLAPFDNANALDNVSRDIKAVFVEAYLPFTDNLAVTLASRYDHYSGFGGTTNPKVSFNYRPTEDLMFRGAFSSGFKVPSFNQLFNGVQELAYTGLDLADPATCPSGVANENIPGCALIQPNEIFGGKDTLQPEKAKQSSFGFVYAATNDFNIAVDWWEIERRNTIRSAPRDILISNYSQFEDNWIRDANGRVTAIDRRFVNSGGSKTQGIELDMNLTGEYDGGRWTAKFNGSHILSFKTRGLDTLPYSDNLVGDHVRFFNLPLKWKHTFTLGYSKGDFTHTFSQLYRSGYNDELPVSVRNGSFIPAEWNRKVGNYITYNYSLGYNGFDDFGIIFGIKNLLDRDPPFTAHQNDFSAGAGWEPRVADPRGRAYTLQVNYKF